MQRARTAWRSGPQIAPVTSCKIWVSNVLLVITAVVMYSVWRVQRRAKTKMCRWTNMTFFAWLAQCCSQNKLDTQLSHSWGGFTNRFALTKLQPTQHAMWTDDTYQWAQRIQPVTAASTTSDRSEHLPVSTANTTSDRSARRFLRVWVSIDITELNQYCGSHMP